VIVFDVIPQPIIGLGKWFNRDDSSVGCLSRSVNREYPDIRANVHDYMISHVEGVMPTHKHQPENYHIDRFCKRQFFSAPQTQLEREIQFL
jgi:hypothetical protein